MDTTPGRLNCREEDRQRSVSPGEVLGFREGGQDPDRPEVGNVNPVDTDPNVRTFSLVGQVPIPVRVYLSK